MDGSDTRFEASSCNIDSKTRQLYEFSIWKTGETKKPIYPCKRSLCTLKFFAVQIYTLFPTDIFGLILTLSGHILKKGQHGYSPSNDIINLLRELLERCASTLYSLPSVTLVTLDALVL